jgi:hypothetical protein
MPDLICDPRYPMRENELTRAALEGIPLFYLDADRTPPELFQVKIVPFDNYVYAPVIRVHDVDMPVAAHYCVDRRRLRTTRAGAIYASRDALESSLKQVTAEIKELAERQDAIRRFLNEPTPT